MADFNVNVEVVDEALEVVIEPSAIAQGVSSYTDLTDVPTTFAPSAHTHDDRYFTETESDARFVRTVNNTAPDGTGNVTVETEAGVSDHGALSGLSDDDHTQYHTDARAATWGDARYEPLDSAYTKTESDARYEPLDSAYTKAEADARYEPFDSAYTKAEADARYVNETDHTKAAHDALDIDADTLDGHDTSYFATATGLTDHTSDPTAAHAASAISFAPAGSIAATDLQAAVAEVASEASGTPNYRTLVTLGSDVTNSTTSYADVTGLSFAVTSGTTYRFHAHLIYDSQATNTGAMFSVNGPASPTMLGYLVTNTSATTSITGFARNAYDSGSASSASAFTAGNICTIEGVIKPSASGTFHVSFVSEAPGTNNQITAKAGSTLEYW